MKKLIPKHLNKSPILPLSELKRRAANPEFAVQISREASMKEADSHNDSIGTEKLKRQQIRQGLEAAISKTNNNSINNSDEHLKNHSDETVRHYSTKADLAPSEDGYDTVKTSTSLSGWEDSMSEGDPVGEYGLAKYGFGTALKWARGRILGREMINQSKDFSGELFPVTSSLTNSERLVVPEERYFKLDSATPLKNIFSRNDIINRIFKENNKEFNEENLDNFILDLKSNQGLRDRISKAGLDPDLISSNYFNYKLNLANNNAPYHEALSWNSIGRELNRMGIPETDVDFDKDIVGAFYSKDVWPRLLLRISESGIELTPEQHETLENIVTKPWENVDMKHGYTVPGVGGYSRGSNFIRYSFGRNPSEETVVHELHHSMRDRLSDLFHDWGYSNQFSGKTPEYLLSKDPGRSWLLEFYPEYSSKELEVMKPFKFSVNNRYNLTPTNEIGATLTGNGRFNYFKEIYGTNPNYSTDMLDDYIDKYPNMTLLDNAEFDLGGYNTEMFNFLNRRPVVTNWYKRLLSRGITPSGMTNLQKHVYNLSERFPFVKTGIRKIFPNYDPVNIISSNYYYDNIVPKLADYFRTGMKTIAGTTPIALGTESLMEEKNETVSK